MKSPDPERIRARFLLRAVEKSVEHSLPLDPASPVREDAPLLLPSIPA
jgi:hypothetical protein